MKQSEDIDILIKELKNKRVELNGLLYLDERNLRKQYLLECVTTHNMVIGFTIGGQRLDIEDMLDETNFDQLIKSKARCVVFNTDTNSENTYAMDFVSVQAKVDKKYTYLEKLGQLRKFSSGEEIESELQIAQLEDDKRKIRQSSIKQLIDSIDFGTSNLTTKQLQLVSILLRSGYIDEHYENYISIFYPESINRADADFLLNVQGHIRTDFDYKLTHCDVLVNKIKEVEFEQEFVLNFGLIDFLLTRKAPIKTRNKVFKFLSNESEVSLSFIDGYLKRGKRTDQFINALAGAWYGMWNFLMNQKGSDSDTKFDHGYIFELIIQHANVSDILKMSDNSTLIDYILSRADFLAIPTKGTKMVDLIRTLNIKFKDLDLENASEELIEFVYESNFYEINITMLRKFFMQVNGSDGPEFWSRNYTRIDDDPHLVTMKEYLEDNLDLYIENVWLKLDRPQKEESYIFTEFLESSDLYNGLKYAIIDKCDSRIDNVNSFEDIELVRRLITANKIDPSWQNLLYYYDNNGREFDKVIIDFLNNQENVFYLQAHVLDKGDKVDEELIYGFAEDMLLCNELEDYNYNMLLSSVTWSYGSGLNFENLSEGKVEMLLNLLDTTRDNYEIIRDNFPSLRFELLIKDPNRFVKEMSEYELTVEDLQFIITSEDFDKEVKISVIERNIIRIVKFGHLLRAVSEVSYNNADLYLSNQIVRAIVNDKRIPMDQRAAFIYRYFEHSSTFEIQTILEYWEEPYNKIVTFSGEMNLVRTKTNVDFVKFLVQKEVIDNCKVMAKNIVLYKAPNTPPTSI